MKAGTVWANGTPASRRLIPHPLLATRFATLLECFLEYGWPDWRFRFCLRTFNLLWVCALRTPLHNLEAWRVRERVKVQTLAGPPVFIIGHWRSGTTHLHTLLSQDPQFGFVSLMQAAFPLDFLTSIGRPLLAAMIPGQRPMDAVRITVESPWEEEMAMASFGSLSFFHAFFFPRHGRRIYRQSVHFDEIASARVEAWWRNYSYFLKKVQMAQPDRRLLLKNPANSARVAALRDRFPGAKFIHIHRHPEEVYASTLFLHRKLQDVWALQDSDAAGLPETVLQNHADLMAACFAQTNGLPERELIEVALTDLEDHPLATIESIYRQLELPGFDAAASRFSAYLEGLGPYAKNHWALSSKERHSVRLALAHVYERWGYQPLAAAISAEFPVDSINVL